MSVTADLMSMDIRAIDAKNHGRTDMTIPVGLWQRERAERLKLVRERDAALARAEFAETEADQAILQVAALKAGWDEAAEEWRSDMKKLHARLKDTEASLAGSFVVQDELRDRIGELMDMLKMIAKDGRTLDGAQSIARSGLVATSEVGIRRSSVGHEPVRKGGKP